MKIKILIFSVLMAVAISVPASAAYYDGYTLYSSCTWIAENEYQGSSGCVSSIPCSMVASSNGWSGSNVTGTTCCLMDTIPYVDGHRCTCTNTCGSTWVTVRAGYERQYTTKYSNISGSDKCSCVQDTATSTYRCAANYYGSTTNGSTGCSACPCMTDTGGTSRCGTSAAGSTSVSGCKMATGYTFNDGTGVYSFMTACAAS